MSEFVLDSILAKRSGQNKTQIAEKKLNEPSIRILTRSPPPTSESASFWLRQENPHYGNLFSLSKESDVLQTAVGAVFGLTWFSLVVSFRPYI